MIGVLGKKKKYISECFVCFDFDLFVSDQHANYVSCRCKLSLSPGFMRFGFDFVEKFT